MNSKPIYVIGAGLAGCECAWQLAEMGHNVVLVEMRGSIEGHSTPAHKTSDFAELVCSNSFGSQTDYSAPGQLKWEAEHMGSLILKAARESAVPAGMALGVDRVLFSKSVTQALRNHPMIKIEKRAIDSVLEIPRPAVIATGPLTKESLAQSIREHLASPDDRGEFLYFFDAIAPIIDADTIDMSIAWKANRFGSGNGDYINCPLNKNQYYNLVKAIQEAEKVEPKEFEKNTPYFDGCMPIEAIVERGVETLRFGPLSPKGLPHPHSHIKLHAVVQLRQENKEATAYNMVGFQTKMTYGEQKRVFRMIPGLENAEFLKLGSIHRNLYIHSPKKLTPVLSSPKDNQLYFAGQITGVEGYFDSTCIGLFVALMLSDQLRGRNIQRPPRSTALGSLVNAITEPKEHFQPTNINFGLFPPPPDFNFKSREDRNLKKEKQLARAKADFQTWWAEREIS